MFDSSAGEYPVPGAEKGLLTSENQKENDDECYKSAAEIIHKDGQLELPKQTCPVTNNVLISAVSMHDNIIQGQDQILSEIKESVHARAQDFSNTESEYHEENVSAERNLQQVSINQHKEIHGRHGQLKQLKAECDQSAEHSMEKDNQEEKMRTLSGLKDDKKTEVEQLETGLQREVEGEFPYIDNKVESDEIVSLYSLHQTENGTVILSVNADDHELHSKDLKSENVEANETVKVTPECSETERQSTDRYHHALSESETAETRCDEMVSAAYSSRIGTEKLLPTQQGNTGKDLYVDSSLTEFENNRCTGIQEDTIKVEFNSIHEENRNNSVKSDDNIMKETKVSPVEFDQSNCHKMPEIANTLKDDEMPVQYLVSQTEGAPKDETEQVEITKTLLNIPSLVIEKDAFTFSSVDKESNVVFPVTIKDVGQDRGSYGDTNIYTQTKVESKIENEKSKDSFENNKNLIGNENGYNLHLETVHAKDGDEKVIETQYDDQFNIKCIENSTTSVQDTDSKAVEQVSLAKYSACQAEEYEEDNKESDSNKEKPSSITKVGDEMHLKDLHTIELADTLKRNILESENAPKYVEKQLKSHRETCNLNITHELKDESENFEQSEKGICERNMPYLQGAVEDVIQGFGEADKDLTASPAIVHKCLESTGSGISKLLSDLSPPVACTDSQMESQNSTEHTTVNNIIPSLDDLLKDESIQAKESFSPRVNFSEVFRKMMYKEKHPTLTATNKHTQFLLKRSLLRKKYKTLKQFCPQEIIPDDVNDCSGMPKSDAYKTNNNQQMVVAQAEQLGNVLHTSDKEVMKLEYAGKESINQEGQINSQMLNRMKKAMESLTESKKLRNTAAVELRINEMKAKGAPNAFSDTSTLKQAVSRDTLTSKSAMSETYKCLHETGSSFSPERKRQFPDLYQPQFEKFILERRKEQTRADTLLNLIRARVHIAAFEKQAKTKLMDPVPRRILRKVKAKKKCSPSENRIDIQPTAQQNVHVTGKPKNVYIINVNNSCPESTTKNTHEINTDKQPQYKCSEKIISRTFQNSAVENQSSKTEVPTVSTSFSQNKHSTSCIVTPENKRTVTTRVSFDSCITIHDSDSDQEVSGSDTVNSSRGTLVRRPDKVKLKTINHIHENVNSNLNIGKEMSEGNVNKSRPFSHGKPKDEENQRTATVSKVGNSISNCAKERLLVKLPSMLQKRYVPLYESAKLKEKNKKFNSKRLINEGTTFSVQLSKQAVSVDRDQTTNRRQSDTDVRTKRRDPKHKSDKGSNTCLKRPRNALQIDIRGNQSKENMIEFVADKLRAIEKANDQTLPKKKPNSLNNQEKGPESKIIQISSDESDTGNEIDIESCNSSDESKSKLANAAGETIIESCESSEESESEQDNNGAYEELDDSGVYDDDYYDYEKEEVQRKRGKKCSAASSCYVVLTKLTCIRHQNEKVQVKQLGNDESCSTKCRKVFLKKYVNCTY